MSENKNSKARIAANNRYNAKSYDRINIAVRRGKGDLIRAAAQAQGLSVNSFIVGLIDRELDRLAGSFGFIPGDDTGNI